MRNQFEDNDNENQTKRFEFVSVKISSNQYFDWLQTWTHNGNKNNCFDSVLSLTAYALKNIYKHNS